jgi:hypothetical protein
VAVTALTEVVEAPLVVEAPAVGPVFHCFAYRSLSCSEGPCEIKTARQPEQVSGYSAANLAAPEWGYTSIMKENAS